MFVELRELLCSGAIRRHQLGAKNLLTPTSFHRKRIADFLRQRNLPFPFFTAQTTVVCALSAFACAKKGKPEIHGFPFLQNFSSIDCQLECRPQNLC